MKKSRRKDKTTDTAAAPLPESEFSFTLARVAVAQICRSIGFTGAQRQALEALTDIATRYLQSIAKISADSANLNGRTQSNLPDVIFAIEEIASVEGFPGAWSVTSRSLGGSGAIKNLAKFVKYTDEIPFAQPLPPRRKFCQGRLFKNRDNSTWYSSVKHVPRWLPAFPPAAAEGNEKTEEKERKREVKWGCLDGGIVEQGQETWGCTVKRKLDPGIDVSRKVRLKLGNPGVIGKLRGEVRFKLGVELGNPGIIGKLRGVGVGKRVWCECDIGNESKES